MSRKARLSTGELSLWCGLPVAGYGEATVDGFWRGALRFVAAALTSDLAVRAIVLAGLVATGGVAVLAPTLREWSLGACATLLVSLAASLLKKFRENRDENFIVLRRKETMYLADSGRCVTYSLEFEIRCRTRNLRSCEIGFHWTGDSDLQTTWSSPSDGYTVSVSQRTDATDFIFLFDQPLRRGQRRILRLKFDLHEPGRTYKPQMTFDPRAYAWSMFARLIYVLSWDESHPVPVDTIQAKAYRSGWERYRQAIAPKQSWTSNQMRQLPHGAAGRQWSVWPVRLDRWYILEFKLRNADIPGQPRRRADDPAETTNQSPAASSG